MDLQLLPKFSTSEWIAVGSAAAAWLAAGIALWSVKTSRQALRISLRQEQRLQSPLDLYLTEAYIRRVRAERRRIYVFRIVITNRADLPNSLRTVDLQVRCVRDGTPGPVIAVPHSAEAAASLAEPLPTLDVPSPVAARGVVAGVVAFNVADEVIAGADVDSYQLSVSDAMGRVTEIEAILLLERDDAEVALDRDSTTEPR